MRARKSASLPIPVVGARRSTTTDSASARHEAKKTRPTTNTAHARTRNCRTVRRLSPESAAGSYSTYGLFGRATPGQLDRRRFDTLDGAEHDLFAFRVHDDGLARVE